MDDRSHSPVRRSSACGRNRLPLPPIPEYHGPASIGECPMRPRRALELHKIRLKTFPCLRRCDRMRIALNVGRSSRDGKRSGFEAPDAHLDAHASHAVPPAGPLDRVADGEYVPKVVKTAPANTVRALFIATDRRSRGSGFYLTEFWVITQ